MKKYFLIPAIFLVFAFEVKSQTDCTYSSELLNDNFLRNSELVLDYSWDDKKFEGSALLRSGNILSVKKWACNHLGTSANLLILSESYSSENWKSHINEISEVVCGDFEKEFILQGINGLKYSNMQYSNCKYEIDISNNAFPEFYISIYELEDAVLISIFFYSTP